MSDPQTTQMLQAILNGQSAIKQELTGKIDKLDKKLTDRIDGVGANLTKTIKGVEKRLTKRIDSIGKSFAYLEEDAPTREEHDELVKRVDILEQKVIPQSA